MALKRVEGNYVWGPEANSAAGSAGLTGIISKSTQRKFSSEVEIVGGDGELVDVVYTGGEETVTETKYATAFNHSALGAGTYATGITTRVSMQYTNEDMSKEEVEKIKKI